VITEGSRVELFAAIRRDARVAALSFRELGVGEPVGDGCTQGRKVMPPSSADTTLLQTRGRARAHWVNGGIRRFAETDGFVLYRPPYVEGEDIGNLHC
jgi:hypothetical protein